MEQSPDQQKLSAARQAFLLTPGQALDTAVSINDDGVDVLLTRQAAVQASATIDTAYPEWDHLYRSTELSGHERRVVARHMAEISLVASAVEQVLMDQDNSDEIESVQQELYGYYSPELFQQAVAAKMKLIEAYKIPPEYEEHRKMLLEKLSSYAPQTEKIESLMPSEQTVGRVQDWLLDHYGDIVDEIDQDQREDFDAGAIVEYFQKTIDSTPLLRNLGWVAKLIERKKSAVSTRSFTREVVVPTQRKVKKDELKTLVIHEINHAMRAALAEQLGMDVGRFGTASYARFEESFMIALEQCLKGRVDPNRGIDHYVAVGLSVTGGLSKDEIASIMGDISFLGLLEKNTPEQAHEKAMKRKMTMINRTFVGMTDVDDGIAHRKDIDYYHGLNNAWKLLDFAVENDILDEVMRWTLAAKFNPFDADDREYVEQYTPMPRQLQQLFSQTA